MKLRKVCRYIKLCNNNGLVRVDEEDFEALNKYNWCLFKSEKWTYAVRTECRNGKQKTIFMHREIMNVKGKEVYVDHKDGDGLNNTKINLRVSNNRFNQYNVGKKQNSGQKYKNIRYLGGDRYQIRMRTPDGVRIHKNVKGEEQAVKIYNELAIKYHGEFAYLQVFRENGSERSEPRSEAESEDRDN